MKTATLLSVLALLATLAILSTQTAAQAPIDAGPAATATTGAASPTAPADSATLDAGPYRAPSKPEAVAGQTSASVDPVKAAVDDPIGIIGELISAIRNGQWRMVAALGLALMMIGLAKARDNTKWFSGDRGGAILVGLLAVGSALPMALVSEGPVDWRLFAGALGVAWTAVGGYTWAKRLIWPSDKGGEV